MVRMRYQSPKIAEVAKALKKSLQTLENKADIVKAVELKALYAEIRKLDTSDSGVLGKEINALKQELESLVAKHKEVAEALPPIDVTAPFDTTAGLPELLPVDNGSTHPLMQEMNTILDIFSRMGFAAVESRQI